MLADTSSRGASSGASADGTAVRAAAAHAALAVLGGENLEKALLTQAQAWAIAPGPDLALLHAITYGVIREHRLLASLGDLLLARPQQTAPALFALVEVGLFQLRSMRIPPHAAVSATVGACTRIGQDTARGLVNAVLRRYQRDRTRLEAALPGTPQLRYSYPDWLASAIQEGWGSRWRCLLAAGNEPAPMTLRVNRRRTTPARVQQRFCKAGITASLLPDAPDAVRLEEPTAVYRLPGFDDGDISVQDAAAQLAAPLLEAQAGMRILDACAAPGGKAAHLLESAEGLELIALDADARRHILTRENFERLHLRADVIQGDAEKPEGWWDGRAFNRILLDAPCSATGVIRRHPDIKWLRRETDIDALAEHQRRLLEGLWPLLARGGMLLYVTCSILDAEGDAVVTDFLRKHADARVRVINAIWGESTGAGRRVPPGGDYDGFYFARLYKDIRRSGAA